MRYCLLRAFVVTCLCISQPLLAQDPPAGAKVDPKADAVLKQMGQALASAKSFTFDVHSFADDILPSGQIVQRGRNQKVAVRRPDRATATITGDREDLRLVYDGKQVLVQNRAERAFGVADAPATLDAMLDMLAHKYGMAVPLADVVFSDPYKALTERVRRGEYVGTGYVFDTRCHHLAFRQEVVDWQIWIEDGPQPLPRKIVITYKESPARAQYTAFLSNWNLAADLPDATFATTPPPDATKMDFAAIVNPQAPQPAQPER